MSAELVKAAKIRSPNDRKRTANDYGNKLYTCGSSIARNALPAEFSGRWYILTNRGSVEAHYAFSPLADAAIDPTPTASASCAPTCLPNRSPPDL